MNPPPDWLQIGGEMVHSDALLCSDKDLTNVPKRHRWEAGSHRVHGMKIIRRNRKEGIEKKERMNYMTRWMNVWCEVGREEVRYNIGNLFERWVEDERMKRRWKEEGCEGEKREKEEGREGKQKRSLERWHSTEEKKIKSKNKK